MAGYTASWWKRGSPGADYLSLCFTPSVTCHLHLQTAASNPATVISPDACNPSTVVSSPSTITCSETVSATSTNSPAQTSSRHVYTDAIPPCSAPARTYHSCYHVMDLTIMAIFKTTHIFQMQLLATYLKYEHKYSHTAKD